MARPLRSHERPFEPAFEPTVRYAAYELGDVGADDRHARALQRQLAEAFPGQVAPGQAVAVAAPGLSLRTRAAVIVVGAGTLWAAISAAAFAVIG